MSFESIDYNDDDDEQLANDSEADSWIPLALGITICAMIIVWASFTLLKGA
jgi:hypothetical protein